MKKFTLLIILVLLGFASNSQITIQNTLSPDALVQNVLMGNGVVASNITYNGSPVSAQQLQGNVSFFNSNGTSFPISSGILLTTGNSIAAAGPNNSPSNTNNNPATPNVGSDPDLNIIANGTVYNGVVLEFDFIPSGDTVSFRYMFGSDEYPEYSPSTFNDAFGFFLTGQNPDAPGTPYSSTNIALIPNTSTAVTINNVGPGAGQNPTFYVNNLNGLAYGSAIQYDGTTVVMTATAHVICGETYHIKLAICNVGDQSFDSGVFLEADSFASEAVDISVATVSGDTTVIENCTNAQFIFTRPQNQLNDTLTVTYTIGGTATNNVDYTGLTNPVVFVPGEDSVVLTLFPLADGINEGPESVIITAITVTECGDTIVTTGTLYIIEGPELNIVETDPSVFCIGDSVMASAYVTNGFGPYTYNWNYLNQTNDTAYFPAIANGVFNFTVMATDACGNTGMDTVTITVNQTLVIDSMITYLASACVNDGVVVGFANGITANVGQPFYQWTGPGAGNPNFFNGTVWVNIPSGWYYFSITDDVCTVRDSVYLDQEPPPVAVISPSSTSGCDPLTITFSNGSQNAIDYEWDFGNGNTLNTNNTSSQSQTYSSGTTIRLIAINGPCRDTAYTTISISICGCTDPNGLNYNPLATQSDGSCVYPEPIVVAPNIFTPNNDGDNDVFELNIMYGEEVSITIVNRWGNIMYEKTTVGNELNAWDGKDVPDGVYFYKYSVKGIIGQEVKGQGFIQLIR